MVFNYRIYLKVTILMLTPFYPWRLFYHNHSCVYIAIIATILQVMLCRMDCTPALKCNGYDLEFWLAGHLQKDSPNWTGRPDM